MNPNPTLFALICGAAVLIFAVSLWQRLSLVALGRPEHRTDQVDTRLKATLLHAVGQRRVLQRTFGLNHALIFWSFLILLMANASFIVEGFFPEVTVAGLFPTPLKHALLFLFDLASLAALAGVLIAFGRRILLRPSYLDTPYVKGTGFDACLILTLIALLMVAYFVLNGAQLAQAGGGALHQPISSAVALLLAASPLAGGLATVAAAAWWAHAVILLGFLCLLPRSKHMHILTAIPNCFLQNLDSPSVPPRESFQRGNSYGAGQATDFSWKDLLDGFACTECGRCQDACPAHATGKPLNPRQVVHALKSNLLGNSAALRTGGAPGLPLVGREGEGTLSEAAVWSCTTCGACVEACPVLIEHFPKVIQLRRNLVQMQSRFPEELLSLFENIEGRSNPWGIAPSERAKWTGTLEVPQYEAGKTEYLLFVGCAGSFDARNKQVTVALASLLNAAGVSWGILGKDEKCCGDSLRRLGNEYVFEKLAGENAALFRERGITKVITQCPHCFSTLKNDYRQYSLELEVLHHSELLRGLLRAAGCGPGSTSRTASYCCTTPATSGATTRSMTRRAR